jgi:hypothetical protein
VLPNPVKNRERINHRFIAGKIDTCNSRHASLK